MVMGADGFVLGVGVQSGVVEVCIFHDKKDFPEFVAS